MYADDGLLFPKKAEDIDKLNDEKAGVRKNQEKSS